MPQRESSVENCASGNANQLDGPDSVGPAFPVARVSEAMTPLDQELQQRLERFLELIRGLTQSPLFKSTPIGLNLTPGAEGLFEVECVAPIDEFGMRGMLTYFRQLWLSGEPAQFGGLRNDLRRHVNDSGALASPELVRWLDDIGRSDRQARRSCPEMSVLEAEVGASGVLRDEAVRSERIIDDWCNGEVFHSDTEKRARINWAGDADAYRFTLLAAIQDVTKVYVLFGRMAKVILSEPTLLPE